jgi:hypothetical protein
VHWRVLDLDRVLLLRDTQSKSTGHWRAAYQWQDNVSRPKLCNQLTDQCGFVPLRLRLPSTLGQAWMVHTRTQGGRLKRLSITAKLTGFTLWPSVSQWGIVRALQVELDTQLQSLQQMEPRVEGALEGVISARLLRPKTCDAQQQCFYQREMNLDSILQFEILSDAAATYRHECVLVHFRNVEK